MSDTITTPRTDALEQLIVSSTSATDVVIGSWKGPALIKFVNHARTLERELAAMTAQRDALREAGDGLAEYVRKVKKAYEFEVDLMDDPGANNLEIFEAEQAIAAWAKAKTK